MKAARGLFARFMNLTLTKKLISGYLVLIVLPVLVFGVLYLRLSAGNLTREHSAARQSLLEQAHANYKTRVSQIESYSRPFQNSKPMLEYLQGYSRTASEEVFTYLTDLKPLFSFVLASAQSTQVAVYHNRAVQVPLKNDIFVIGPGTPTEEELRADSGQWRFEPGGGRLYYTTSLYDTNFTRVVGYLRLWVPSGDVLAAFEAGAAGEEVLLRRQGVWYDIKNGGLAPLSAQQAREAGLPDDLPAGGGVVGGHIINLLVLNELDATVAMITPASAAVDIGASLVILLALLLALVVLSALYYMIANSLSRRLINLRWHIRRTDFDRMIPHDDVGYADEIGDVIRAFNKMILRIRDLLSDLNIAELKKREADFYALQAQIKPHFIYNALETIRMTAEANGDGEAADLTYSLGRFIRYSLSMGSEDSTLAGEAENVESFLQIYKGSLGSRLAYTVTVAPQVAGLRCPAFLLQPLVENAIHHSLPPRGGLEIHLTAAPRGDAAVVTVADNGMGMPPARMQVVADILADRAEPSALKQTRSGIGVANIHQRLKSYYNGAAAMQVAPGPDGGVVWTIVLPAGGPADT